MSPRPPRHTFVLAAGLAALVAGAGALAIAQDNARRRILHEDLPPPSDAPTGPVVGEKVGPGQNPAAFASGQKLLPEPPLTEPADKEPVLGTSGFAADRQTESRPDRETGSDGTLRYVSVFNPDVLPFKRMSALDAIADDYTLGIARTSLVELPVGGSTTAARDRFWGSVMVQLSPGTDVPLPSVAPDMRILSYETEPPTTLTFSRDGADNFYVRSDESAARGTFRLIFMADADAGYFAPKLPTGKRYTPRLVRELAPPGLLAPVPPRVAQVARGILDDVLHVSADDPLDTAFNTLVGYFRAFQAKDPPPSSGDIYRDLTLNKAGVCRHRAFAFMVTANTLGIPTRYVTNEAHAFVEVWFPERGWQRIDLGGAALRMEVSNAEDKTLHRPRAEDPFEKPKEYDQSYTQLEGDIGGLTGDQIDERNKPVKRGTASGDFGPLVVGDGPPPNEEPPPPETVGPGESDRDTRTDPAKVTPKLSITLTDPYGYRGESLRVEGRADAKTGAVEGLRIDVFLAPLGRSGNAAVLVGRTATAANGTFTVEVDLPGSLDLRTYEVFVSTPGDERYNAGISE